MIQKAQLSHPSSGGRVWLYDGGTGDVSWSHPEVKSNPQVQVRLDVGDLVRGDFEDEMLV